MTRGYLLRVLSLFSFIIFFSISAHSQVISSTPSAIYWRTLDPLGEGSPVGINLLPYATNAVEFLDRAYTNELKQSSSVRVTRWDAEKQNFTLESNGKREAKAKLLPGSVAWIEHDKSYRDDLFIAGEVVLEKEHVHLLTPGTNLLSSAYPAELHLRGINPHGQQITPEFLEEDGLDQEMYLVDEEPQIEILSEDIALTPGLAFWLNNLTEEVLSRVEKRPFMNPFVEDAAYPEILSVTVDSMVAKIEVDLHSTERGATYALYVKEATLTNSHEMAQGWKALYSDIPAQRGLLELQDDVFPLVDSDKDGISDAEEFYINQTDPLDSQNLLGTGDEALNAYWRHIRYAQTIRYNAEYFNKAHIYLDKQIGRKELDGLSADIREGHGPKNELDDAISNAEHRSTIHMKPGIYEVKESIRPNGDILLKPTGGDIILR
jgi:hypothetical protein